MKIENSKFFLSLLLTLSVGNVCFLTFNTFKEALISHESLVQFNVGQAAALINLVFWAVVAKISLGGSGERAAVSWSFVFFKLLIILLVFKTVLDRNLSLTNEMILGFALANLLFLLVFGLLTRKSKINRSLLLAKGKNVRNKAPD